MKKLFSLFIILFVFVSLTSCTRKEDPGLVKDYELEEVSFEKATKLEWELKPIDSEYSYVSDFFHDDRDGSFLRIYHNEVQVYEELSEENFYEIKVSRIHNSIYLYYWQPKMINDEEYHPYYIVRLDENFHKEILVSETDWRVEDIFFDETRIVCLKTSRTEDISILVELNYEGQVINSQTFETKYTDLFMDDEKYYLQKRNQFHLFNFTNGLSLYDEIDNTQPSDIDYIKIQNGILSYVAYQYNDESCEIHYYDGKEDKIILTIPKEDEDLAYYCESTIMVQNDIFIPVRVQTIGLELFSFPYYRMLVFHYDGETQQVKLINLKETGYTCHVIKNRLFIGQYHGESNGTSDGDFYSFDLEEAASKIW